MGKTPPIGFKSGHWSGPPQGKKQKKGEDLHQMLTQQALAKGGPPPNPPGSTKLGGASTGLFKTEESFSQTPYPFGLLSDDGLGPLGKPLPYSPWHSGGEMSDTWKGAPPPHSFPKTLSPEASALKKALKGAFTFDTLAAEAMLQPDPGGKFVGVDYGKTEKTLLEKIADWAGVPVEYAEDKGFKSLELDKAEVKLDPATPGTGKLVYMIPGKNAEGKDFVLKVSETKYKALKAALDQSGPFAKLPPDGIQKEPKPGKSYSLQAMVADHAAMYDAAQQQAKGVTLKAPLPNPGVLEALKKLADSAKQAELQTKSLSEILGPSIAAHTDMAPRWNVSVTYRTPGDGRAMRWFENVTLKEFNAQLDQEGHRSAIISVNLHVVDASDCATLPGDRDQGVYEQIVRGDDNAE